MIFNEAVGLKAVQSLSVDIANLTSRLAILTGMIEHMVELAEAVDQSFWSVQQVADPDVDAHLITIPGTEADKLQQLLALLNGMK